MACYYKDKNPPRGCCSWKGIYYNAKVLQIPSNYKTQGVTVMYQEEGDPVEQGVLLSSIKVLVPLH